MSPHRPTIWAVLRSNIAPLYLPVGAIMFGAGILVPIIPLYLTDQGVSLSMVGLITAAAGIGAAAAGIPASAFAERYSNDLLLTVSIFLVALGSLLFGFTDVAIVLLILRFVWGLGFGGMGQSRQTFIARTVASEFRGRVSSLMGGTHRLAFVVGPVVGGAVSETWGFRAAFVLGAAITSVGLVWIRVPGAREPVVGDDSLPPLKVGPALWTHRRLLGRVGIGPMLIMAARDGRFVIVPLVADSLELSPAVVGVLVAVGTAADFALFPLAGYVMDRFGRLYATVPAFSCMACGLVLLGLADTTSGVVVASVVIGLGNGLSSGAILTLGSDLAPEGAQGPFLAGFNLLTNIGIFLGPAVVGWSADLAGLDTAAFVLAGILAAGLAWVVFVIGETGASARRVSGSG